MASENHASFAKVGFIVVAGVVAIIGALIYFGGYGDTKDVFVAETYFEQPVSGLSVGSEVNFRGVKVGEVTKISFIAGEYKRAAEEDGQIICVRMAFNRRLVQVDDDVSGEEYLEALLAKGLRAKVSSSGITGLSKIELNFPRAGLEPTPAREISWKPDHPWIPGEPSMLESFSDSATRVMAQLKKMDVSATWGEIKGMVDTAGSAVRTLDTIVASQQARIDQTLVSVEEAARAMKELVESLKENPGLLLYSTVPEPLPETTP